ncbi:hypothetical protein [Kitasatospora sp. NPDC094015]|uniref:hypothetical protein n=1 Tax=Kitasatospora sp. NPDC094015 TaxID=3155205 RepID=UPI0033260471
MPGRTFGAALVLALGVSTFGASALALTSTSPAASADADPAPAASPADPADPAAPDGPPAPAGSPDAGTPADPAAPASPVDQPAPDTPGIPADGPADTPATTPADSPATTPADTPPATTTITIAAAAIDPKIPSRVKVDLDYLCTAPTGERSLNTSVEQTDPTDPATVAFGATRSSPTVIVCDGTPQHQTVVVQSKTSNWIPDVAAVVVTTLSDLGAAPPAAADARKLGLPLPATTTP